jgi:predicted RND superfamily exporter protein
MSARAESAVVDGRWAQAVLRCVEPLLYRYGRITHAVLLVLTALFTVQAARLQPDAGWLKSVPLDHPYMQVFRDYYADFGGANTVLVALIREDGDIYDAQFMSTLQQATEDVFFMPGVDRTRTMSLFTPNVSFVENVEGGLAGALVIPADYTPTPQMLQRVRANVAKAQVIGRLVTADEHGALIMTELLETHPQTGEKIDYREVGDYLEQLRQRYETPQLKVHIIGFAKVVDDMTRASAQVVGFFALTLLITALLLWWYCGSIKLALVPLASSLVAVIWELGLLRTLGFGLDPFAILVPFLILAVSVSHGVQYVNGWVDEVHQGASSFEASRTTFRRLAIAGTVALLTDVAGFATIYFIAIQIVREMSINAMLGGVAIIVANKLFVPLWLTSIRIRDVQGFKARRARRDAQLDPLWWRLATIVTDRRYAAAVLGLALVVLALSVWGGRRLIIGDAVDGFPELRPQARLNQDFRAITQNFDFAVDQLKIIAESHADGCVDYEAMRQVDRFSWQMQNTEGVASVMSLLSYAKIVHQGLSDGRLNALTLPRNQYALAQTTALVPTTSGLLNDDCSALAIVLFTRDHRADTIERIVASVQRFDEDNRRDFAERHADETAECDKPMSQRTPDAVCAVRFALASGNVGVMAASNEVIRVQESRVVLGVYAAILLLLWTSLRSLRAVVCIIVPLALVSTAGYAVMALLDIGLKVATLPVLALAVGIGVDYGIYVYGVLDARLAQGSSLRDAYFDTLRGTGKAVIFTGITLVASVATWLLSALQFQRDMGQLLLFMFTANMLGAVLLLPALAAFLSVSRRRSLHEHTKHCDQPDPHAADRSGS